MIVSSKVQRAARLFSPGWTVVVIPIMAIENMSWVVGDEPCVVYDTGVTAYAKPQECMA